MKLSDIIYDPHKVATKSDYDKFAIEYSLDCAFCKKCEDDDFCGEFCDYGSQFEPNENWRDLHPDIEVDIPGYGLTTYGRYVIRETGTEKYFAGGNAWTNNPVDAHIYKSKAKAVQVINNCWWSSKNVEVVRLLFHVEECKNET